MCPPTAAHVFRITNIDGRLRGIVAKYDWIGLSRV